MRIHTSEITSLTSLELFAEQAHCTIGRVTTHGSKSRERAFNVLLSGSGIHGGQFGSLNFKAATYDEWGIFLNLLFAVDPNAHTRDYRGQDDYHVATGHRFRTLAWEDQHKRHKWSTYGYVGGNGSPGSSSWMGSCRSCEASYCRGPQYRDQLYITRTGFSPVPNTAEEIIRWTRSAPSAA